MVSVAEALNAGTRHHQAGQLAEAERSYRQVLALDPRNAQALHLLGVVALQVHNFSVAIDLIGKAIQIEPRQATFHANLGEAYRHSGRLAEAAECYRRAVQMQPNLATAQYGLGVTQYARGQLAEAADLLREALRLQPRDADSMAALGLVLQDQKKLAEAETCFRGALEVAPSDDARCNLAGLLMAQGKLDQAADLYREILDHDASNFVARNNLGTILKRQDAVPEAIEHFRLALLLRPHDPAAHTNLGAAYETLGRTAEALVEFRAALAADPQCVVARNSLGAILQHQTKLDEALECFRQVLEIEPRHVPAYFGLASVAYAQGDLAAALNYCQQALTIEPDNATAYLNMAKMLNEQGRRDEAIAHCRRALALDDALPSAHSNLAIALQAVGQIDEALLHHRREVEVNPGSASLHSNFLYSLNYPADLDPAMVFAEHRAWGRRHADPLTALAPPHGNERTVDRRLRVGYVSPYFYQHAVNYFVEPILAAHDHTAFEIVCYSDVERPDRATDRLRGYVDTWREIVGQGHAQVADLLRQDQIDILVDLTGHIGGHRLLVFARKPAPIQVTYIGYQNTTGMMAMDYRLTDDYSDPPGQTDAYYTERLLRLPDTFFCYLPPDDAPLPAPLPADQNGFITFGSFNHFNKVTPRVLQAWAEILKRLPAARLVMLVDPVASLRQHTHESFGRHGVDPRRLELVERMPHTEFMRLLGRVDIALDPFPFNGHTTSCDSLWQGVPVVSLAGQAYVSRFGSSALVNLGLNDLIANSVEQYVEVAAGLAGDVERLRHLRENLRGMLRRSPILDAERFTRNLEAAYRRMWTTWCGTTKNLE